MEWKWSQGEENELGINSFFFSFFFSKNLVSYKIKINKSILKNKNKNNNDLSSSGEVNKKLKVSILYTHTRIHID